MPRYLALEWDHREARVAVAIARHEQTRIEHAFVIPLADAEDNRTPSASQLGQRIAAALRRLGIDRPQTLVAVWRASIELKRLSLPPAPADELPGMVRFQATREFNALSDDWLLDYIPLSGDEQQPHEVLAAALSPDLQAQISETCRAAGLSPQRLVLRPCAAASLLSRRQPGDRHARLFVDVLGDEADLAVLVDSTTVFMRTVRLPAAATANNDVLSTNLEREVRRTLAAAQNQLGGQRVEAIDLFGGGPQHEQLAADLTERLGMETRIFDPFDGLALGAELRKQLPADPGRFAPLLGMLLDEAASQPPAIDFFRPRQAPQVQTHRRSALLAATAAVLLVVSVLARTWLGLAAMDDEIEKKTANLKQLDVLAQRASETSDKMQPLRDWLVSDLPWLDELDYLATKFPPSDDAFIHELRITGHAEGGLVQIVGRARDHHVIDAIQEQLRDERHRVRPESSHQDDTNPQYGWEFTTFVTVLTTE